MIAEILFDKRFKPPFKEILDWNLGEGGDGWSLVICDNPEETADNFAVYLESRNSSLYERMDTYTFGTGQEHIFFCTPLSNVDLRFYEFVWRIQ
jgi:hypothetical protein